MTHEPASGVLGPVPVQVLLAVVQEFDPDAASFVRAIPGERDHHAVVDDDETDIAWADEVALELSRRYPGTFYAFAVHPDFYWLTSVEGGEVTFSDEGAIDGIARDVGCPIAG
jgi:hypothetical protein